MSASIPLVFQDSERQLVQQTLLERYNRVVPVQDVEVDMQLDANSPEPTACPALYWIQRDAEFVVCKTGPSEFRAQFFYGSDDVYGTGIEQYDSLGDCVISVLQVQADHEVAGYAEASKVRKSKAAQPALTGDDYDGPLVI